MQIENSMALQFIRWLSCTFILFLTIPATVAAAMHNDPIVQFSDVSQEAGITMQRTGDNKLSKDKVTGQAWGDYDNDGWLDLYLTDSQGANVLYHNQGDGTFALSPHSDEVALAEMKSGGAIFADYDNDGWSDLYVLNWGANILFHNEAGQGFKEVTDAAGVGDSLNGKTASWGDYNQDGYLDLYVANWACEPRCGRPVEGDKDRLYQNNGDGTFRDVTRLLGGWTRGAGFVASFADVDNDGDLDLYLVNDEYINPIGNILWRNDGPGCDSWCFTNISVESGANRRLMGMGLATGDYDNDGDLDFYFSNVGATVLLQNQGDGTFLDQAEAAGVQAKKGVSWGTFFFDYDNDGWLDLYLAVAGAVGGERPTNRLFHNKGDGTFTDVGEVAGVANLGKTLGVAYADYDHDGWVDLVIGNFDEGYTLYRNQGATQSMNHWLTVELSGVGHINRDAIGSRVYLTTSDGERQMQEIKSGSSLGAGNSLRLHFGVGVAEITTMRIVWPDGVSQQFVSVPHNQIIRLAYPIDFKTLIEQYRSIYGF